MFYLCVYRQIRTLKPQTLRLQLNTDLSFPTTNQLLYIQQTVALNMLCPLSSSKHLYLYQTAFDCNLPFKIPYMVACGCLASMRGVQYPKSRHVSTPDQKRALCPRGVCRVNMPTFLNCPYSVCVDNASLSP